MRALALLVLCGCGTLPENPWWFTATPGGKAWAERAGNEVVVHHDGRTYGPYA